MNCRQQPQAANPQTASTSRWRLMEYFNIPSSPSVLARGLFQNETHDGGGWIFGLPSSLIFTGVFQEYCFMAAEFVPGFRMDIVPSDVVSKVPSNASGNERERLRFILMGSTAYIRDMQLYLAHAGVAAVGDWSRLLPAPDSSERPDASERMSILVQYRMRGAP